MARILERGRHSIDQFVGSSVLEAFGLVVYVVPRVPEAIREVGLQHTVAADDPERFPGPRFCETNTTVRDVLYEPRLVQAFDHTRHGRRLDVERFCKRACRSRLAPLRQGVDGLQVVLDRPGEGAGRPWRHLRARSCRVIR